MDIKNLPTAALDPKASAFFDQGSWHAFALVPDNEPSYYGGFSGPFLMTDWRWISKQLSRLYLLDETKNREIDLNKATLVTNVYLPGRLVHVLKIDDFEVRMTLIFLNDKTSLINVEIENTGTEVREIKYGWAGELIYDIANFKKGSNRIEIHFKDKADKGAIHFDKFKSMRMNLDESIYRIELRRSVSLPNQSVLSAQLLFSRFDTQEELDQTDFNARFARTEIFLEENQTRWRKYLSPIVNAKTKWAENPEYQRMAVKSILTLINNWKGPRGALRYSGLIPSYNIHYFNGFWAWDSWKHAAALAHFAPSIAQDQMRAMFYRQNNVGMIPDCIFADPVEDNWRDTKPPLSAWAIYEMSEANPDDEFLNYMYSKLVRYHQWWYKHRDHDQNGLCEYGSTDGTLIAAKWESGMDNAVRFDHATMVKNDENAYSMDLESVDLNSYLYAEKIYLAKIARKLKEFEDAKTFEKEAESLKTIINSTFFDQNMGYFFDRKLNTDSLITTAGPEGWIPLWSNAATQENAKAAFEFMSKSSTFSTFIPFPTVSKSSPEYSLGYWRGTVWIDQVYFAIKGLRNYGYHTEADTYTKQIFDRLEGLVGFNQPIMENYNPENGNRLNVNHFSWSAAHLLMLYLEK